MPKRIIEATVYSKNGKLYADFPETNTVLTANMINDMLNVSVIADSDDEYKPHQFALFKGGDKLFESLIPPASRIFVGSYVTRQFPQTAFYVFQVLNV